MKAILSLIFVSAVLIGTCFCYTNVYPSEVHARLVAGDTLIILDVREVSEYTTSHIAEPAGQLPLTPVNMPWSSNVLRAQHSRLPNNVDIIVHCASGGRSVNACLYLDSLGYTRNFNLGAFSSWVSAGYETRSSGYGDHSGRWVRLSDVADTIFESYHDISRIGFRGASLAGSESIYVELHLANGRSPLPPDIPPTAGHGLFRVTALDRFGLSIFIHDSLPLADTVSLNFVPEYPTKNKNSTGLLDFENLTAYVPGEGWRDISFSFETTVFHRSENILRRWYNCEGTGLSISEGKNLPDALSLSVFPNPFNSAVQISVETSSFSPPYQGGDARRAEGVKIEIFDIAGKMVAEIPLVECAHQREAQKNRQCRWQPDLSLGSGIYFIRANNGGKPITKRVIYLK